MLSRFLILSEIGFIPSKCVCISRSLTSASSITLRSYLNSLENFKASLANANLRSLICACNFEIIDLAQTLRLYKFSIISCLSPATLDPTGSVFPSSCISPSRLSHNVISDSKDKMFSLISSISLSINCLKEISALCACSSSIAFLCSVSVL